MTKKIDLKPNSKLFLLIGLTAGLLCLGQAGPVEGAATSFDFIEIFDNITDWRGSGYGNEYTNLPSNDWHYYSI